MKKPIEPNGHPIGQTLGYLRVSTVDQNEIRQLSGIHVDRKFTDRVSGTTIDRPELQRLIQYARDGDTVIVHSMDRLARNVDDLRRVVSGFNDRGVKVQFVRENLTFTGDDSPMSNLLLSILGAVAQFERDLIRERQREGIAQAKKRGVYKGRPPKLTAPQREEIRRRMAAGESPTRIAREYDVNRQSVYRCVKESAAVDLVLSA